MGNMVNILPNVLIKLVLKNAGKQKIHRVAKSSTSVGGHMAESG